MRVALASDHAGFAYLAELQLFLKSLGHEVKNYGPPKLNPDDDYPDYIIPAARAVGGGDCDMGIVLGGSGQGEAMAANKIKGVRCAVFYGPAVARKVVDSAGRTSHNPLEIARLSRQHNDANMLSIAARFVSLHEIKQVIKLWLETPFSGEQRHKRRIDKVNELGS